jgi:hypothetical protein
MGPTSKTRSTQGSSHAKAQRRKDAKEERKTVGGKGNRGKEDGLRKKKTIKESCPKQNLRPSNMLSPFHFMFAPSIFFSNIFLSAVILSSSLPLRLCVRITGLTARNSFRPARLQAVLKSGGKPSHSKAQTHSQPSLPAFA